jgi:branched-chain amino acid transport system substrate-binding protein
LSKSPTVDTQIVTLKGGGADAFLIVATPKFAAQAIRRSYDLGWTADRYATAVSESIATVLEPGGAGKGEGPDQQRRHRRAPESGAPPNVSALS